MNKVLGIDLDIINNIMKQSSRKYNYTKHIACLNPKCNTLVNIRIIGDQDSANCGLPILKHRKKVFCSIECQKTWQRTIPWEERVGKEFSEDFRKKMSQLSSTNNPSRFPGVAEKISSGVKQYITDNPGIRSGENNGMFGKSHSEKTKQHLSQSKLGKWAYTLEQKNKQIKNTPRKENHPNWHGGISNGEYGLEFNKELKNKIKETYNFECQICNLITDELDIHHIDYNKKHNSINNLIPLCKTCHGKTNFDRETWEKTLTEHKKRSNINTK